MATLRRTPSGNWQTQVRRTGLPPVAKTFSTRSDAIHWGRKLESEMDRGVFTDQSGAESTTIGELIDRYLIEVTPLKKSAAKEVRRLSLIRRHFGAFSPAKLQGKHVAAYRDARLEDGKASATVLKDLNSLSHVLDVAMKDWGLPLVTNPVTLVRRPPGTKGRDRRLKEGEETRLLATCGRSRSPLLSAIAILAVETGMRLGELLALEWHHVDLKINVALLIDTKNGESRRVPLSTRAVQKWSRLFEQLSPIYKWNPGGLISA